MAGGSLARNRDRGGLDHAPGPALASIFGRLRERFEPKPLRQLVAVGWHGLHGWRVLLLGGGQHVAELEIAAARQLAAEILEACDVLEGAD